MKVIVVTSVIVLSFLFGGNIIAATESGRSYLPNPTYHDYPHYRFYDLNGDGWFNFGDIQSVIAWYARGIEPACPEALGGVIPSLEDVLRLMAWFDDQSGPEPETECTEEVPAAEGGGFVAIEECFGNPGETYSIKVYVEIAEFTAVHFSLSYFNDDIEAVSIATVNPILETLQWGYGSKIRENLPPGHDGALSTTSFYFGDQYIGPDEFDPIIAVDPFEIATLEVSIGEDSQLLPHPLFFEADPYYGPPRFFNENGWDWSDPQCFLYQLCEESYFPGDVDHNGIPLELGDVLTMIFNFRGSEPPNFICHCPMHGLNFAPTVDPNGNCVPYELNDVVTEIGAYRGSNTVSGCEDCPGSSNLLLRRDQQLMMPILKSKVKVGNSQMAE